MDRFEQPSNFVALHIHAFLLGIAFITFINTALLAVFDFDDTVRRYYSSLCLFAEKIVGAHAADVVQDNFVRYWEQGTLDFRDDAALRSYLYAGVKYACLNLLRSQTRRTNREEAYSTGQPLSESDTTEALVRAELFRELLSAIEQLPEPYRMVMHLTVEKGMSPQEIASLLRVEPGTVRTQKARAIVLLRKLLQGSASRILLYIFC